MNLSGRCYLNNVGGVSDPEAARRSHHRLWWRAESASPDASHRVGTNQIGGRWGIVGKSPAASLEGERRGPAAKTEREHGIIGVRPTATILGGPRPQTLALAPRARFATIDTLRQCSDNDNVASKWGRDNQLRLTADGVRCLFRLAAVAGIEALQSQKTRDPLLARTRHVVKPPKSPR
jgi:hypothetical protein